MHSSWWLSALLVVPLLGASAALLARRSGRAYAVALVTSGVELVLAIVVALLYNPHVKGMGTFDFATRHVLSAPFGLAYDAVIGRPLERAARYSDDVLEPKVLDGAVAGVAGSIRRSAVGLQKVQSGFARHYALAMVLGTAVIVVFLVARVG